VPVKPCSFHEHPPREFPPGPTALSLSTESLTRLPLKCPRSLFAAKSERGTLSLPERPLPEPKAKEGVVEGRDSSGAGFLDELTASLDPLSLKKKPRLLLQVGGTGQSEFYFEFIPRKLLLNSS
jgi:hypothetical protein